MTDEIGIKSDNAEDGDKVAKDETKTDTDTKENRESKPRSVSFNRDVHVKRFGKPRDSRGASSESQQPIIRKEPFTHLSEQELINEANKVIAQAESVTCTADHPPEKFFSLPHRKKLKEDRSGRRNSDDGGTPEGKRKSSLGRSTSDVTSKKRKDRTSLSTLFRRAQRNKSPEIPPVIVTTKPVAVIKRSKSDVSDLKSNTTLTQFRPIRKRSGSESEEFLKSLRNKKTQLSPIIESSPREDYFQKTSPLEVFQKQNKPQESISKSEVSNTKSDLTKVNPVLKPPRYRTLDTSDPKPPNRIKKINSSAKDKVKSPQITEKPNSKTGVKTTVLIDKTDSLNVKESGVSEVKGKIKESIRKIKENIYGGKEMVHSSQQPPEKPPLTRGNTVDHMVKILKEDQYSPPPKLSAPTNGTNINQPFSYTKPSTSPDPNLFIKTTSPDRAPSPVNKMTGKGVIYAHVVRDRGDVFGKQTIHKTYSPSKEKYGNFSDEDEGLGFEEKHKYSSDIKYDYDYKPDHENNNSSKAYKITDSPIRPRFREYKLTSFEEIEPTYANEYPSKENYSQDYINKFRGRADGMDTKKRQHEIENHKVDLDFNELSHRRQLLESRINARKIERERNIGEPISRYLAETDPIYEAQKRMKATEKYVNETAKYYRHTLEKDGFAESTVTEDYSKYDSDNQKIKYNSETRTYKIPKDEADRRDFDCIEMKPRYKEDRKVFPPEPEYEPPSLEFNARKPVLSPDEYKEKKYKVKKPLNSSHDLLHTGQRYKGKEEWFGKRKGHYASNPEIAQEREDDYANIRYLSKHPESYHNSLRRSKSKDRTYKGSFGIHRHDSGDSRDYYRENGSPRRYDIDNRLVDSGIENDFRKDSSGEIHRSKHRRHDSDDDVRDTSLFLDSERRHTEDNYPSEQIYANGEYLAKFEDFRDDRHKNEYVPREMSAEDRAQFDHKVERYEKSPSSQDEKVNTKPPKPKKLSGLERVKQLFSRDSSKKSKKEKDAIEPKTRTRVLKSPEHLARDDSDYRRYTDPEPSDITDFRKKVYDSKEEERRYRSSREDLNRHRSSDPRDSDPERKYRGAEYDRRYERTIKERRYKEEKRRQHSSDRESDRHSRPSDGESDMRKSKPRAPARPVDSPQLAERYRERRRLATPSPTPSPPRRQADPPPPVSSGNWFKSLERVGRKRDKSNTRDESILTTEDESTRKSWSKSKQSLNSPAKNLRFFGDTDPDSDSNTAKHSNVAKSKNHTHSKTHSTLKNTLSNSSTGIDEVDQSELSKKSYSLSNLHRQEKSESPRTKQYYKRSLHNISEIQSNSEVDNNNRKNVSTKPPMSPYDRRSRSQSSSKTLRGSKNDLRRHGRSEDRGSSSDLRSSKQDISRDLKQRHRTPAPASGESSTEGDSSHHSQRSVVYLHATTVGDIPDPGRLSRNRSKDDVSSVNSSNLQIRTTTKSFSLFAPWTPKHYNEQHDVHYAQRPRKAKTKDTAVKTPPSSKLTSEYRPSTLQKNKSYSQSTLSRRPQNNRLSSSSTTLYKKPVKSSDERNNTTLSRKTGAREARKSQSNEVLSRNSDSERISRSISMPKDKDKKAGWFKLSNKNKKQEINTRVR